MLTHTLQLIQGHPSSTCTPVYLHQSGSHWCSASTFCLSVLLLPQRFRASACGIPAAVKAIPKIVHSGRLHQFYSQLKTSAPYVCTSAHMHALINPCPVRHVPATWHCSCRGIPVAVKVMHLPALPDEGGPALLPSTPVGSPSGHHMLGVAAAASPPGGGGAGGASAKERKRATRREQMAVMEAALGSSLNHPNILQVSESETRVRSESDCATRSRRPLPAGTIWTWQGILDCKAYVAKGTRNLEVCCSHLHSLPPIFASHV